MTPLRFGYDARMSTRTLCFIAPLFACAAACKQVVPHGQQDLVLGPNVRFTSDAPDFGAAVAAGDFDGDGEGDVAVSDNDNTWVFLGPFDEDRHSDEADVVMPGHNVQAVDLDGDGTPAVVTTITDNAFNHVLMFFEGPFAQTEGDIRATITILSANLGCPW